MAMLVNHASMTGFVFSDYSTSGRGGHGAGRLGRQGSCPARDIAEGFENFPETLLRLFSGAYTGKLVLKWAATDRAAAALLAAVSLPLMFTGAAAARRPVATSAATPPQPYCHCRATAPTPPRPHHPYVDGISDQSLPAGTAASRELLRAVVLRVWCTAAHQAGRGMWRSGM